MSLFRSVAEIRTLLEAVGAVDLFSMGEVLKGLSAFGGPGDFDTLMEEIKKAKEPHAAEGPVKAAFAPTPGKASTGAGAGPGSGPGGKGAGKGPGKGQVSGVSGVNKEIEAKKKEIDNKKKADVKKPVAKPPGKKPGAPPAPPKKKAKAEGAAAAKSQLKTKAIQWDPIADATGTAFTQGGEDYFDDIDLDDLDEVFAKKAPKAPEVKEKAVADKSVSLLADKQRSKGINIVLSQFSKLTFIELREAILDLDKSKIPPDKASLLVNAVPSPDEFAVLTEFIKGGGDVKNLDKAEQFVAAMMGIPLMKERLQALIFSAEWDDTIARLQKPMENFNQAVESLLKSERLKALLAALLKVGNILNQANAPGFKTGVLPKLDEIKTTKKPTRTLVEYLVDVS